MKQVILAAVLCSAMLLCLCSAQEEDVVSSVESISGTWEGTCYQSAGYLPGRTEPPVTCLHETLSYPYTITFNAANNTQIWDSPPAYGRRGYYPAYLRQSNEITIDEGSVRLDSGESGCLFLQRAGKWLVEYGAYTIEDAPSSRICSEPSKFLLECNQREGYNYYCVYSRSESGDS